MKMFKVTDSEGKVIKYNQQGLLEMLNKQFDLMEFEEVGDVGIIGEINIPISEYDVEMFKEIVYSNDSFDWSFPIEGTNEVVQLNFMSEDEEEQRGA